MPESPITDARLRSPKSSATPRLFPRNIVDGKGYASIRAKRN